LNSESYSPLRAEGRFVNDALNPVNLKTAKALGLDVPATGLTSADGLLK
jgi:hypothetical protein